MSETSIGLGGYIPPGFLMQHVVNPIARAIGRPTLIVRGRISGREISIPVGPFHFGGDTYVIAGRGETQWVRNLRVAGRCELRIRWHRQPHLATELRGAEHQLVVASYLERLGRRAPAFLAELPNPADHPIFRLEPTGPPVRG
ncbi:nitroreductase/quinone reductase family protein [Cryobacterium sp. AP23]